MRLAQIAFLVCYAAGMAGGQMLLKQASAVLPMLRAEPLTVAAWGIATNPWLATGVVVYCGLTVFWVWILSFTPLALAYPFVALAIGITSVLAHLVFAEPLAGRQLLGLTIVVAGLIVMVWPS